MEQLNQLLTVRQTAKQLALQESTIRKWIFQGRIPKVKMGRSVRINRAVIEKIAREGLN